MNLINQHIRKHLLHFQNEEDSFFQEIFTLIEHDEKEEYILLLRYIHLLLNETFLSEKNKPNTLHLHFLEDISEGVLLLISQYLIIRLFKQSNLNAELIEGNAELIKDFQMQLKSIQKRLDSKCPDGASGKNGGNRIYREWKENRKYFRELIEFYKQWNSELIYPNSIFNCKVSIENELNRVFNNKPYGWAIGQNNFLPTFNLINTNLSLNQIDEIYKSFIDNLKTVVVFDCERKKLMRNFSLKDITDFDIDLEKYLILSFGNKHSSVQSLRDKLTLIRDRFKISKNDSYSILQSEIDYTLKLEKRKHIPISFVGIDNSSFWDAFLLETNVQDLYELRSIKMMNLYSLCLREEIKTFILNDLFSENDTSEIVSDETKQRLLNLSKDDLSELKDSLKNVLDLIIHSDFKQILSNKIKNETIIVVDDFILKNKKIKQLLSTTLQLSSENKLSSWSDFKYLEGGNILILSYQDQGRYPYYFYPNIIETTISIGTIIGAVYHKFLFLTRYQWAKYNVAKDLHKISDHPVRQKYFQWDRLRNSIKELKPQKSDDTNWDLEQQYSGNTNRETIKLKLKGEREKTFNSSDFFIFSIDDKQTFKVDKIGVIIDLIDENEKCFLYNLDEIQESINLYEKMIDTTQQEDELNIIRQNFQIDENATGRLWKILLQQKASGANEEDLYEVLKNHLDSKGLKIVSFHHFKNNWLNPESDSMAPLSKKVFIELCNFLGIPIIYFTLICRLRNSSKQASSQSTRQMNRLLQDLFNDGCFDEKVDTKQIITNNLENYKRKHPLDELGIDEKYLGENLITLVELIKEEVTLKELEKFKKME